MTRRPDPRAVSVCRAFLVAAVVCVAAAAPARDREEVVLAPHVATYGLTLHSLRAAGKATRSGGEMVVKLERICEGWRVGNRLTFAAGLEGGDVIRLQVENGVEESADGSLLSFATSNALNDAPPTSTRGAAQRLPEGGGRAVFTEPARREIALPKGVLFPVAGVRDLLRRLRTGERRGERRLFDGSAPGVIRAVETVGDSPLALVRDVDGDSDLLDAASWRVDGDWRLLGTEETVQRTAIQFHGNGVASRMLIDLGVLTIAAGLTEIRRLPEPRCGSKDR